MNVEKLDELNEIAGALVQDCVRGCGEMGSCPRCSRWFKLGRRLQRIAKSLAGRST